MNEHILQSNVVKVVKVAGRGKHLCFEEKSKDNKYFFNKMINFDRFHPCMMVLAKKGHAPFRPFSFSLPDILHL